MWGSLRLAPIIIISNNKYKRNTSQVIPRAFLSQLKIDCDYVCAYAETSCYLTILSLATLSCHVRSVTVIIAWIIIIM